MFEPAEVLEECEAPVGELDDDALVSLVRGIAAARAQLEVVQAQALAEVERRELHRRDGHGDVSAWLADLTHVHEATARRTLTVASLLGELPAVAAALAKGAITVDHVERLGRCADEVGLEAVARDQAGLVAWATELPATRFVRRTRQWVLREHERAGRSVDQRARRKRGVSSGGSPVDGLGFIRARLPLDEHRIVMNVLWALVREQWRAEKGADSDVDRNDPTINQRLADALVEMARRAAGANPRHRARPAVVVTIPLDELRSELAAAGIAHLDDGTPASAATARRLACEAGILPAVLGGDSVPLDLGRSRRLASDQQRLAMMARSQTCEWPGCNVPATWCEAHHLSSWENGGPTDIDNLAWACTGHHHLAHEGGWTMTRLPDGTILVSPPDDVGEDDVGEDDVVDDEVGERVVAGSAASVITTLPASTSRSASTPASTSTRSQPVSTKQPEHHSHTAA